MIVGKRALLARAVNQRHVSLCMPRMCFSAKLLETPSHTVSRSRSRSAKEYVSGSDLSNHFAGKAASAVGTILPYQFGHSPETGVRFSIAARLPPALTLAARVRDGYLAGRA